MKRYYYQDGKTPDIYEEFGIPNPYTNQRQTPRVFDEVTPITQARPNTGPRFVFPQPWTPQDVLLNKTSTESTFAGTNKSEPFYGPSVRPLPDSRFQGSGNISSGEDAVASFPGKSFSEAFKMARRQLGAGKTFKWNGKMYTTLLEGEEMPKTGTTPQFKPAGVDMSGMSPEQAMMTEFPSAFNNPMQTPFSSPIYSDPIREAENAAQFERDFGYGMGQNSGYAAAGDQYPDYIPDVTEGRNFGPDSSIATNQVSRQQGSSDYRQMISSLLQKPQGIGDVATVLARMSPAMQERFVSRLMSQGTTKKSGKKSKK